MDLILVLLILIIPAIAQMLVTTNYNRYKLEQNENNLSGFEVASAVIFPAFFRAFKISKAPSKTAFSKRPVTE